MLLLGTHEFDEHDNQADIVTSIADVNRQVQQLLPAVIQLQTHLSSSQQSADADANAYLSVQQPQDSIDSTQKDIMYVENIVWHGPAGGQ